MLLYCILHNGLLNTATTDKFAIYFRYCRDLKFTEKPDYVYLKRLFHNLSMERYHNNAYHFSKLQYISVFECIYSLDYKARLYKELVYFSLLILLDKIEFINITVIKN